MTFLLKCARGVVLMTLGFTLPIIAALAAGWSTSWLFGWDNRWAVLLLFVLLFFLAAGYLISRYERRITWKHLCVTAALVTPVVIYLGWDEPAADTSLNVETLAPSAPRGAESYALTLWFPRNRDEREPKRWPPTIPAYLSKQLQAAEWRVFVMANRDAIRADWAACTAARDWITRLDAFEVIGDLTTTLGSTNPRIRQVTFHDVCVLHCAYASLLAIEGRGDEALAVLRPMLSVSRKLKPTARTIHRYVTTGGRGQRLCQNAVQFVLQTTTPSAAALRQIDAVLALTEDLAASFRRVALCECAFGLQQWELFKPRWSGWSVRFPSPISLFYNPNATANLVARYYREVVDVAIDGRGEGLGARERAAQRKLESWAFKNAMGRWMAARTTIELDEIVKDSLTTEDHRRALLAEVRAKLAEMEKKEAAAAAKHAP